MADFTDVFSTTVKVVLALLIIAAVIGVGSLMLVKIGSSIPIGDPEANCQQDAACREAKAEGQRIKEEHQAEHEATMRTLKTKRVYLRDGDAAGDLYVKCTSGEPPQQPANKKRCQALLDRVQKEDAKQEAADAKAKANW
jgi:hypothetical protein